MASNAPAGSAVRLQTHVYNPAGRRRALLVHGLCSDGACWWRLASSLAGAGWLVLAPDLRGHGRSPTADRFDLPTLTADVRALGTGWDLVVGHSLGGAIAASLLAEDDDVTAAVLVDPVLRLEEPARQSLRVALAAEAEGLDAAGIREANPGWHERDVWRKAAATRLVSPDVVHAVLDDNDPWDLRPLAGRWRTRIELLGAAPAAGGLLDPVTADEVVEAAPCDVRFRAVDAGHSIHRERPEVVRDAVRAVLPGAFDER